MDIEVIPLSSSIGAEIRGVNLSQPISGKLQHKLLQIWHKHLVLLFRGQKLSDKELWKSGDWIGQLGRRSRPIERRHENDPYIMLVSNIRKNGKPIGSLPDGEMWFHHDMAFVDVPHKATFLYSIEVPQHGGNTKFANMYDAFDRLPHQLKKTLSGKRVLQLFDYKETSQPNLEELHNVEHAWQPAIIQHPDTGRKALYINRLMTATIEGIPHDEARKIIAEVLFYAEHPSIIYEHVWKTGDFLVWDNRCSSHARTDFSTAERRLLKRGMVEGAPLISA